MQHCPVKRQHGHDLQHAMGTPRSLQITLVFIVLQHNTDCTAHYSYSISVCPQVLRMEWLKLPTSDLVNGLSQVSASPTMIDYPKRDVASIK